jgi:hypothetical protein
MGEKFHRGVWNIWGRAHLGFFCGCGKGTILPCWKLLRPVHEMDHTAAREGPRSSIVHQYLPYPMHQAGYQEL